MKHLFSRFLSFALCLMATVGCSDSFDDRMAAEAKAFTKQHCPKRLDNVTTLDSATYDVISRTYARWYSLSTEAASAARGHEVSLRQGLVGELLGDVTLSDCKAEQIAFRYVYRRADTGEVVIDLTITPADYGR
ncbi:MAG: hypothetical protein ACI4V2_06915 [Alloprevotella sp.]